MPDPPILHRSMAMTVWMSHISSCSKRNPLDLLCSSPWWRTQLLLLLRIKPYSAVAAAAMIRHSHIPPSQEVIHPDDGLTIPDIASKTCSAIALTLVHCQRSPTQGVDEGRRRRCRWYFFQKFKKFRKTDRQTEGWQKWR
jgi:hypothetical protein